MRISGHSAWRKRSCQSGGGQHSNEKQSAEKLSAVAGVAGHLSSRLREFDRQDRSPIAERFPLMASQLHVSTPPGTNAFCAASYTAFSGTFFSVATRLQESNSGAKLGGWPATQPSLP